MTAPVRIEAEAWSDLRFATLARLLGLADLEHALIKTARIWSWQTEHYTPDEPTYVVDADLIESALGPGAAAALVRSRLAVEEPGGFRIRGSKGRIEWLWQRRVASARGGEARKRSAHNKAKPGGYPDGSPDVDPGPEPEVSPLSLALSPDPEDQSSPSARAIAQPPPQPVSEPAPRPAPPAPSPAAYDHTSDRVRGLLAEATYQRVSDARVAIAAELKLPAQLPFPPVTPSSRPRAFAELLDRVREEGPAAPVACDRVVTNLVAQARETRDVEWLSQKAFGAGAWATARERTGPRRSRGGKGEPAIAPPRKPDPGPTPIVVPAAERAAVAAIASEALVKLFGTGEARAGPTSLPASTEHPDDDSNNHRKATP